MLRIVALSLSILALAVCTWAASPVGSVSSAQPFDLNGANIPVAGVPMWPIAAGDLIATHSAPATIEFRDGSRVILAENSEAKIEAKGGKSVLRLLQGSGECSLAAHPSLSVFVLNKEVPVRSTNGQPVRFCVGGGGGPEPPEPPYPPTPPKPPSPSPCK
jgi:hypothetical protein